MAEVAAVQPTTNPAHALIDAAARGDGQALKQLIAFSPEEMPEAIREVYDLQRQVEGRLIDAIAGRDLLQAEGTRSQALEITAALAGPEPSPLEVQLAQQITCDWLQVKYLELQMARALRQQNLEYVALLQKWYDKAHRRFLQAMKTLAQVRRLLGPSVQVNIAERQINVS